MGIILGEHPLREKKQQHQKKYKKTLLAGRQASPEREGERGVFYILAIALINHKSEFSLKLIS
jgi:hypothetical protein